MSAPAWLDELSLEPGPPWLPMGTRSLDPAGWLVVDTDRSPDLASKAALLAKRHEEVFAALGTPTVEAAAREVLHLVETAVGEAGRADVHPLEAAARLVQEDLCILVLRDGGPHLDAGSVCFPSYWRLRDKLGRPLSEVHAPVAHYGHELAGKVDRFVERLHHDRPVWRRNWSIHDDPSYFLPDPTPPQEVEPPEGLWLRSERQTLRRLRTDDAVLFTIRTQQTPLASLAERPEVARAMATAIAAWSPELADYKGTHGATRARSWLASR